MLIAVSLNDGREDKRNVLILGLSDKNIKRLVNDEPIHKNLGGLGLVEFEEWDVVILGPEDMARFVAHGRMAARQTPKPSA